MENSNYTVVQMVDYATNLYELDPTKSSKRATREAIVRDLKAQGVWDKNVQVNGTKTFHFIDQATAIDTIHVRLLKYFKKRAGKAWVLAEQLNNSYQKHLDEMTGDDKLDYYVNTVSYQRTQFQEKLNDIMLQALFEKFFSLDTVRLEEDLLKVQLIEDGEVTPAQAAAYDRTKSFEAIFKNYITEK